MDDRVAMIGKGGTVLARFVEVEEEKEVEVVVAALAEWVRETLSSIALNDVRDNNECCDDLLIEGGL